MFSWNIKRMHVNSYDLRVVDGKNIVLSISAVVFGRSVLQVFLLFIENKYILSFWE